MKSPHDGGNGALSPKMEEGASAAIPKEVPRGTGSGYADAVKRFTLYNYWEKRNDAEDVWLDKATVNTLAVVLAYAGYLLRVTPNHLSLATAFCAVMAFVASVLLPVNQPHSSIIVLYLMAQLSYAFDCADGLFARVTDQETDFGEFLDKSIDAAAGMLCFGALFGYLFRYYSAVGQSGVASLVLVVGFLFIVARSSRYFALHKYQHMFRKIDEKFDTDLLKYRHILLSLMDFQASTMGMLLFLLTPWIGLGFYGCQTLILSAVYLRYFRRANLHDKTSRQRRHNVPDQS